MADQTSNVTIGGYPCVCVKLTSADFTDIAAVYVVICVYKGGSWKVLDVGQTGELGDRIDSHDRRACWWNNCPSNNIWVCVYRMPSDKYTKQDTLEVEKHIRNTQSTVPCGKR